MGIHAAMGIFDQEDSDPTICHAHMSLITPRCKRPIHNAPPGVDEKPVCFMHSKDPVKGDFSLSNSFWYEFHSILEAAGEGFADFSGFVFPFFLPMMHQDFKANCLFEFATFTSWVEFSRRLTFSGGVSFVGANFTGRATFKSVIFGGPTSFNLARFRGGLTIADSTFENGATFNFAKFSEDTEIDAVFLEDADFDSTTFEGDAKFRGIFNKNASFANASFAKEAVFSPVFGGDTSFIGTRFKQHADFRSSVFSSVNFSSAQFSGSTRWENCSFAKDAIFSKTELLSPDLTLPQASFALASFNTPKDVLFHDIDLSRTLFNNCDISDVQFTSSVRWDNAPRHRSRLYNDRESVLYDEIVPLITDKDSPNPSWTESLLRDGERDYKAIAQAYQRLKKNYDGQLDYWTANEFHFGEMEMQRRELPTTGPILALRRWWHPRLSFKAFYRYASDYGNNYSKPMHWLIAVLVTFALLVPIAGLQRSDTSAPETYRSVWIAATSPSQRLRWEAGLIGKSLLTAVDTATFQKGAVYSPAYPWGRALAIVETLLTSTLFALFLLAIRRQFRR